MRVAATVRVVPLPSTLTLRRCFLGAELAHRDVFGGVEHRDTVGIHLADRVLEALFEVEPVHDHHGRAHHRLHVVRRCGVVMRVLAVRDEHLHGRGVADELGHDVAEDRVGDHHQRLAIDRHDGLRSLAVVAGASRQGGRDEHADGDRRGGHGSANSNTHRCRSRFAGSQPVLTTGNVSHCSEASGAPERNIGRWIPRLLRWEPVKRCSVQFAG